MKDLPIDDYSTFNYVGMTPTLLKYSTLLLTFIFLSLLLEHIILPILVIITFIVLIHFSEMDDLEDVNISVSRFLLKDQFLPGESIPVVLKITNHSSTTIYRLEIEDILHKKINVLKGSNFLTCSVNPKETIFLSYVIQFPERGTYRIGPMKIQIIDKSGLVIKRWYESHQVQTIYVVPNLVPIKRFPLKIRNLKLFGATFVSSVVGYDEDFRGVREYQMGDPIKHINWFKTAKASENILYVNEYSLNMGLEVYIVLDLTKTTEPILEYNIEALISIYDFFLRHGARIGHILIGETVTFSRARRFKFHFQRLGRELATVNAQNYKDSNILKKRLLTQVSRTPDTAVIILISPLLDETILQSAIEISEMRTLYILWSYSLNFERNLLKRNEEHYHSALFYHNLTSELFSYHKQVIQQILSEKKIPYFFWDVTIPFYKASESRMR